MAEAQQHAVSMEKVIVKVAWCGKNFGGTFGDNVPGAAVFTARTFAGLRQAAEETLRFHVEGMAADGEAVPQWLLGGDYYLAYGFEDVAAMLRACEPYVSLAAISRASGINQGQLSHYANGLKKPREGQRRRIVEGLHKIGSGLLAVD